MASSYTKFIHHLERDAARTAKQKREGRRRGRRGRRSREAGVLSSKKCQLCAGLAFCVSSYWLAKCFRNMRNVEASENDLPGVEFRPNLFESVVQERANSGLYPEYAPQQPLLDVGFQPVSSFHQHAEEQEEEVEEEEEEEEEIVEEE